MLSDLIDGGHSIVQLGIDCFLLGFGLQKEETDCVGRTEERSFLCLRSVIVGTALTFGLMHMQVLINKQEPLNITLFSNDNNVSIHFGSPIINLSTSLRSTSRGRQQFVRFFFVRLSIHLNLLSFQISIFSMTLISSDIKIRNK